MLTEETLTAAKSNNLGAITTVIEETEPLVMAAALRHATISGRVDEELRKDLAQTGRLAVWEGIGRWEGSGTVSFLAFIERTVHGAIMDARWAETRSGVGRRPAKDFQTALRIAGGDPYKAQKVATQAEHMGADKMSPETAYAARMAWQGVASLDLPIPGQNGSSTPETVGSLLPSTVGIPEDLIQASDIVTARQRVIRESVHRALDIIPKRRRFVLKATFGIDPVPLYGADCDGDIAAELGITKLSVQQARSRAMKQFEDVYVQGAA
ncbi:RNA polymerase sigma factor (sigma-70 family) [Kitasatospora sp. MAP12-15]|uniref:sigma-70 family RNA polymerase sigma factor n=1 Tax=unclassified Kitasatospora TaxID=2633591 RepID=UPI002475A5DA|nr:sigma factor [Kitasatospora sp. MAP12-44]MDH6108843.1 RNA polymerase sigma factor (sigma-70 family) [Kitasatospora sp. MAP12-44]